MDDYKIVDIPAHVTIVKKDGTVINIKHSDIIALIDEEENKKAVVRKDGVKFYYNPSEITVNDYVLNEIKRYPAEDMAYTVCVDSSQGLIIY
ncbi:hypothetical protein Z968_11805 [Clostridium novyi A str. 4552]|uniref:Uncharacterized protein n=1 Tax=Clostridium novyi A str. 4552 TaxID=1444289 RepID=A0A0A0I0Q6_CLONO|nr:hypothetical protein [Clostridium novyi]KGM94357.1 hypothetical protein Z968_11805 [Clostridium novyi A str. 4552]